MCVRMNDKVAQSKTSDEGCDLKALTHHGVDALREREELNQSRNQVEGHKSRAKGTAVGCGDETENST